MSANHSLNFLATLIGDGNIHISKNAIGYTTGDRELADRYAALLTALFAIEAMCTGMTGQSMAKAADGVLSSIRPTCLICCNR